VSGTSAETIGESICIRCYAPRSRRLGEGRIGQIKFAERPVLSSAAYPYNVRVPGSRSSGAIPSERAAAEVEESDAVGYRVGVLWDD
jgi:hypothetical protein